MALRCGKRGMLGVESLTERTIKIDRGRVTRPAYGWTATVHELLRHLRANGFQRVPQPLALVAGSETLTRIPGRSGVDGWRMVVREEGLRSFAGFLREYHEATKGFQPSPGAGWAFHDGPTPPGSVICHGDIGPWNMVWRKGLPVGLVNFDFAGPGDPILDVAYALDYVTPFCDDEEALRWRAYTEPPDRRRRLSVFVEAYGWKGTPSLVDAVIAGQELDIVHVRTLAERDIEPQRTWVQEGMLERLAERVHWTEEHRALFE